VKGTRPVRAFLLAALLLSIAGAPVFADEPPTSQPKGIGADVFIESPFAEHFLAGEYPQALEALETLADQYPDDPMVLRYRAVVLDRLGRYDEAITIYDELLAQQPNHVPTRFFRAQTYYRSGQQDRAVKEWNWVVEHSNVPQYRQWSKELLDRLGVRAERPPERRRVYMFGNVGWEYDSNVLLKSNDPGTAFGTDRNASRATMNLGLGYRLLQEPDRRVRLTYTTRQSLNDDSLSEFNFTGQEVALNADRRVDLWDRDVNLGFRYEVDGGFLDGNIYSLSNRFRLSGSSRLTPQTRTYLYNRFSVSDYGRDGRSPPQTSRDGFYYDAGVTQYFYSEDRRSYVYLGEEFELDETRGANFTRRSYTTRVGLRLPVPEDLLPRTHFDTNVGFEVAKYPRFVSRSSRDQERRRNHDWTMYFALTHRIRPRLRARAFYRYINANNRNDIYQYDRHVGGTQLLFTQYF